MAATPNSYETLADGGVEQDMARTWTDTAATLRLLGEKVPALAAPDACARRNGQGDGTWLIDAEGEPVAPGLALAGFARRRRSPRISSPTPPIATIISAPARA